MTLRLKRSGGQQATSLITLLACPGCTLHHYRLGEEEEGEDEEREDEEERKEEEVEEESLERGACCPCPIIIQPA